MKLPISPQLKKNNKTSIVPENAENYPFYLLNDGFSQFPFGTKALCLTFDLEI